MQSQQRAPQQSLAKIESRQQQTNQQPQPTWGWQPQWGYPSPVMPQSPQANPFVVPGQPQSPVIPSIPQSPAIPSPTEKPPAINPPTSSVPSIPPPPPSIEDLERQAAQKVSEGDFASAAQIYRTSYHEALELSARVTSASNWLWLCNNCDDMTRLLKNTPTPSPLTSVKLSRA
jgi:hypothetical protein